MFEYAVDAHLSHIVLRHNADDVALASGRGGNNKGIAPILGRHGLREYVVALFLLIRNVGVWATLEYGNFLAIACFDICAAQVSLFAILLSCPNIENLSLLERLAAECVANGVALEAGIFRELGIDIFAPCIVLLQVVGICFCCFRGAIVNNGIVFCGDNGEMRTLCRISSGMVGWCICLDKIAI